MTTAAPAREYILGLITTLKLTEKEISSLEDEAAKWAERITLARSVGEAKLLAEAEREAERINGKLARLREEERTLKDEIAAIKRQLPGLNARERSVDPDLLEQELLMALGSIEREAGTERAFRELEDDISAASALEALKAKMKGNAP